MIVYNPNDVAIDAFYALHDAPTPWGPAASSG